MERKPKRERELTGIIPKPVIEQVPAAPNKKGKNLTFPEECVPREREREREKSL
jgi:hypothetical protein